MPKTGSVPAVIAVSCRLEGWLNMLSLWLGILSGVVDECEIERVMF